jgi:hypothetical protein
VAAAGPRQEAKGVEEGARGVREKEKGGRKRGAVATGKGTMWWQGVGGVPRGSRRRHLAGRGSGATGPACCTGACRADRGGRGLTGGPATMPPVKTVLNCIQIQLV